MDEAELKREAVTQALALNGLELITPKIGDLPNPLKRLANTTIPLVKAPAHNGLWPNGSRVCDDVGPNLKVTLSRGLPAARDALARCNAYDSTTNNALPTAAAFGFATPTDTTMTIANSAYDLGFARGLQAGEQRQQRTQQQRRGGKLGCCFPATIARLCT